MTDKIMEPERILAILEADPAADLRVKIDALNNLAWELRDSNPERSLRLSLTANELATSGPTAPYPRGAAYSLRNTSYFNLNRANNELALAQAQEALELFEALGDLNGQGDIYRNLGLIHASLGNHVEALTHFLKRLELAETLDDRAGQAQALTGLSWVWFDMDDYPQAIETINRGLAVCRAIGMKDEEAGLLNNLAMTYYNLGDYTAALSAGQQSLQLAQEHGCTRLELYALGTLGEIYLASGDWDQAWHHLQQTVAKCREHFEDNLVQSNALFYIGCLYQRQGQWALAESYIQQALELATGTGLKIVIFQCYQVLADLYKQQGDFVTALAYYEQFHTVEKEVFNQRANETLNRLRVIHKTETTKKEAEIYQLKNVQLEREIAERQQAEAEARQRAEEMGALAADNARLFEEAQRAKVAAELANRAKSDFLAHMSHELRTPLNGILGYTQILKRDKNLSTPQQEILDIIYQSGEHLRTLINDILDLAKIEAGKLELDMTPVNLPDFLNTVAELVKLRAHQKGLGFRFEPSPDLPAVVKADETRLRQVLLNLLCNAVKFTDQGGITWRVDTRPLSPANGPAAGNGPDPAVYIVCHFEVIDTGTGISQEQLDQIFLPFEQLGETKRRSEGTGLGLTISRRLVHLMGSELLVHSQLGQGSTFEFEVVLPIVTPTANQAEASPSYGMDGSQPPRRISSTIVPPPAQELITLYELGTLGKISRLRKRVDYLVTLDECYRPFADKVRALIKSFDTEQLQVFLKEYLDASHDKL